MEFFWPLLRYCRRTIPRPLLLGVRREGVTGAAGKLQKLGVIDYSRGHITVLDRARLEGLCCECYAAVKHETDRLLSVASAHVYG